MTALHIACYRGLYRAMKSLIEGRDGGQGADVNKKDNVCMAIPRGSYIYLKDLSHMGFQVDTKIEVST